MPDRLATQLLLMARDPASGRIPKAGRVDIVLRAALFTDLLLAGRIVGDGGAPAVVLEGDSGDRVLDAVVRAVAKRPGVPWWRWFRHVRADRAVLIEELVESGRWTARPGRLSRWDDADELVAQAQCFELSKIARQAVAATDDVGQGTLAVLAAMAGVLDGHPRPRAVRGDLKPVLEAIGNSGVQGAGDIPKMVNGAAVLSRRSTRR